MINISVQLSQQLKFSLPESYDLLQRSNLAVHPAVYQVVLSGSRGPKGGCRPNSDIDLSLLVDSVLLSKVDDQNAFLRTIVETTINNWESDIELDTVAVFDRKNCGLKCFSEATYHDGLCHKAEDDCLGLYKIQKGFSGLVPPIGVQIRKVFPIMAIWKRNEGGTDGDYHESGGF